VENYNVVTNLLLDTNGFTGGVAKAQVASENLAKSITASMAQADAAFTSSSAAAQIFARSQAEVGAAAQASSAEQVAANEKVAASNASLGESMKGMGVTSLMAAVGMTIALDKMVKGAMETDAQLASMKTALTNLGLGAADEQFVKLAENNTVLGFNVTKTAQSLQTLATLTHSSSEAIRLNSLAMDIARAKHIDLASATSMVQMEMRGAARGFTQFGVTLDTTLPKAQAINKAMNDVQKAVSGQAQDYMKTAAGKLDALKSSFGQVADVIGRDVLPVVTALLGLIQRFLPDIAIIMGIATAVYAVVKAMKAYEALQVLIEETNPFTYIALAIGAVIAAILILWNHFKIVRDIIVDIADVALHAFGDIIKILGWVAQKAVEIFTAPLRAMLTIASKIPFLKDLAKPALAAINEGIDKIGTTADAVGNKINSFQKTIDKMRNVVIKNPFATHTASVNDKSTIKVDPLTATKTAAAAALKAYTAAAKSLDSQITSALKQITDTRQKGSDAISAIVSTAFGQPSDLQKAFDSTKATADTVLAEYDKLRTAINDRMVGYAESDKAHVLDVIDTQTNLMLNLVTQRDNLATQIADATKLQSGEIDTMAKSLIDYGIAAGILQTKTSDTIIRIIQTASGAIVTQGNDTLNAVDSITTGLQDRLATMQAFMANINSLKARGLNADYIKQLISAGIASSGDTVSALTTASNAQISAINSTYSQITSISNDFANTTGANLYDSGITNLQQYIDGLKSQQTAVQNQMNQITANMTTQLNAMVPMSANVGTDTATALLTNLATYINDPKNQTAVLANATALADKIKSILADAMSTGSPTPQSNNNSGSADLVTATGAVIKQATAGLNALGGQKDLSNYGGTPNVTITIGQGAITLDANGNPIVDPSKVAGTIDYTRVSGLRMVGL